WYVDWFHKTIALDEHLFGSVDYRQAMQLMLQVMKQHQWFEELYCGPEPVWLMKKTPWLLSTQLLSLACDHCGNRQTVVSIQQGDWLNMTCLTYRCYSKYRPVS